MPVRPWNIDHSCFSVSVFSASVWPPQYTVQRCGGSLFASRISRPLRIGEEDHSNEIAGHFHQCRVYPRDFPGNLRLLLVGHKIIFGDSGVERHSPYPPNQMPTEIAALATMGFTRAL